MIESRKDEKLCVAVVAVAVSVRAKQRRTFLLSFSSSARNWVREQSNVRRETKKQKEKKWSGSGHESQRRWDKISLIKFSVVLKLWWSAAALGSCVITGQRQLPKFSRKSLGKHAWMLSRRRGSDVKTVEPQTQIVWIRSWKRVTRKLFPTEKAIEIKQKIETKQMKTLMELICWIIRRTETKTHSTLFLSPTTANSLDKRVEQ